ncbi:selenide, water dikinase SelD [Candidatus Borrarchaeum sp.]|uniref:selenide, water dikinase SelD n=1 Tax=Candidatus Borrarchaeum sp. TaxID=2846742 RepID=UPI00257AA196|nr:selenide, water dikinase SelD [Candidatus Borrarchaeum sp.]
MPQADLEKLLESIEVYLPEGSVKEKMLAGAGDDAAVIQIRDDLALIETVDFFTPNIDEPMIQGEISACNTTNDIYAMGAVDILSVLVVMGAPTNMPFEISRDLLKGFKNFCERLGTHIVGGHTIINPWPFIGGCVVGLAHPNSIVYNRGAKVGDILFLTKPLGTQPAMAAYRLLKEEQQLIDLSEYLPTKVIDRAIQKAIEIMTTTNRPIAEIMQEIKVNAATDVTGFGLTGHAREVATQSKVNIVIDTMPIIKGTNILSDQLGYSLMEGTSAETAGGMLLSLSRDNVDLFKEKLIERGIKSFEIGHVKEGSGQVNIVPDIRIIEV